MLATATADPPRYIDSLTPLRGIAALWVVVFHVEAVFDRLTPAGTGLVSRGYLWVDFFFLLSGFVVAHVYGDRLTRGRMRGELIPYVVARFSRVYPLHLVTLAATVALWAAVPLVAPELTRALPFRVQTPETLPQNLALVHAHGTTPDLGWNFPSWSIAAEWWTYLAAPLLLALVGRRTWRASLAIGVAIGGLAALERLHPRGTLDVTFDYGWLRCLLGFTIGVGVYELYRARRAWSVLRTDGAFVAVALVVVAALHRTPADVLVIPAFAALVLAAAHNDGRVRAALAARPLRALGDVSYSIYLMQGIWLLVVWFGLIAATGRLDAFGDFGLPPAARALLVVGVLAATIGSAALTYRFVEVPARAWIRRRATRRLPRHAVSRPTVRAVATEPG